MPLSSQGKAWIEVFDSDVACIIDVLCLGEMGRSCESRSHNRAFRMLINVSMTMVVAPLTFLWDGRWQDPSSVPGGTDTLSMDVCLDFLYAIYLLLMLEMSYLHPEQRTEIVTSRKIRRWRLWSPIYWLKWLSVTVHVWAAALGWPLFINTLKVVRGGVFIELPDSLWRLRDSSEVRLTKPIILLIGVSHWVACLLFCFGGFLENLQQFGPEASETTFRGEVIDGKVSSYVVAYVEAIYMLTGALDGPTGDGAREGHFGALIIVVIFAPIGQLVVSLFIAAIVQEQDLKNALDKRHNENKAFMQRAVQTLGIPKELQRRVFSMHYFQKMSHDIEAFQILFDGKNLSGALSSALKIYLYKESVLNCAYLRDKDPNYIIEVVKILHDVVCLPGEYIARRGEIAHQMFFIARGTLSVLVPDVDHPNDVSYAKAVRQLKLSDYFGEVALIKDCVRTAWIRADSYALLSSLSRFDIEPVWKYFPDYKDELSEQVSQVAAKDKKRNAQNRWKNVGLGEKRKKLMEYKAKVQAEAEAPSSRKTARGSILAASIHDEPDDQAVLESGDSAALNSQEPADETTKMLTELLQRQTGLEKKFEEQGRTIAQILEALQSRPGDLPPLPPPPTPPPKKVVRKLKVKRAAGAGMPEEAEEQRPDSVDVDDPEAEPLLGEGSSIGPDAEEAA
ncbi:Hcn4 [Symbiodinium pilosum]|uniref:Hcn4 protein n=1 Tax=Symbiodinium pilosum TaxID=2952 RepID=A0A812W639_SYMPI|nr:Hcn4 [Symbiodinium pilosum]